MNAKLYNRLVEFAKALKPRVQSGDRHHTAFILKKNRTVCVGWNNYRKSHNENRFGKYMSHKFQRDRYTPCVHAECSACIKMGESDLRGYDMAVIRIDNNNRPNMSKPCVNCQRVLDGLGIRKVFYSDAEGNCAELGAESGAA